MSGARQDLAALGRLAAMIRDAELDRLRAFAVRRRALEAEAAALRAIAPAGGLTPASLAGADAAWQDWRRSRLAELSEAAARTAAAQEAQRLRARRAFGRADALARLGQRRDRAG